MRPVSSTEGNLGDLEKKSLKIFQLLAAYTYFSLYTVASRCASNKFYRETIKKRSDYLLSAVNQLFKRQWRKKTYLKSFGSRNVRLRLHNLGNKTSLKNCDIENKTNGYRVTSIICYYCVNTEKTWFQTELIRICSYPCNRLYLQKHLERNFSAFR